MMKIMIIEVGGWGGIAHYTYNLLEALSAEGVEAILLTDRDYELEKFPRAFRIVRIPIKNQPYFKAVFKIINSVLEIKPDVIHIQSLIAARKDWIFFILARLLKSKIIFTAHNIFPHDDFERNARGMRFAFKSIYAFCGALIIHSEDNKKELFKNFNNIKDDNVFVIPHGHYFFHAHSQPELTKGPAREKLGLSPHDKVVLCFGAIREYKGIQYLIPAFRDVTKEIKEARLIIAGPAKEDLIIRYNGLIKGCNLEKFVVFHPCYIPLDEINLYFKASDIAVFPYSHTYGSGALQSAFAFSKPVIVTDVDVFREMVKNGRNGYIVPPKDIGALAKAIIKCLSMDSGELEKMGEDAFCLAKAKYSWIDIAKSTINVYKGIVGYDNMKILIVAPDFGPPYNERWRNEVREHSQILKASILGTSTIAKPLIKYGNSLIFNNNFVLRYTIFLIYLLFIQRRYDYVIFEGNIDSRFNQVIYKLIKIGLIDAKKCVGVSFVTQKWINPYDKRAMYFIRNIIPRLRYFLVNDEEEKQTLKKLIHASDKLIVVKPGIDLEKYSCVKDSNVEVKEFSFLFVSAPQGKLGYKNEFYNKGLYVLLSAFKRFIKERPGKMYLVWRGVFLEEMRLLINELNIVDGVEVVDQFVDTAQFYRRCSVTVFPIQNLIGSPHYPMSVMESLACGCPVIVSDKARISVIIKEENCGVVIEPNEEELYKAMCYISDNYEGLKANCRKAAERYFDYRKNFGLFVERLKKDL